MNSHTKGRLCFSFNILLMLDNLLLLIFFILINIAYCILWQLINILEFFNLFLLSFYFHHFYFLDNCFSPLHLYFFLILIEDLLDVLLFIELFDDLPRGFIISNLDEICWCIWAEEND